VLTNIFHQRIDYPGYDFEAEARKAAGAGRERAARARAS
jgi:hypothetical protein